MTKQQPRGIRNNNPGNIRRSADKWQGLAAAQPDAEFFTFQDATYGIRALARVLIKYQDDYGCKTVADFMQRYAPPSENNTGVYARAVAHHMGISVNDAVDVHAHHDLRLMIEAIIEHENGGAWASWYSAAQLDKGMVLAGVQPPVNPLPQSRTIRGASLAGMGITLTTATDMINQTQSKIEPLIQYADTLRYVFLALSLIGIALTVYAKLDERRKGIA